MTKDELLRLALHSIDQIQDDLINGRIVHAQNEAAICKVILNQALAQPDPAVVPEGFSLVAVKGLDELVFWLDRCEYKGHLENCPDLVKPYENFEYREISTHTKEENE